MARLKQSLQWLISFIIPDKYEKDSKFKHYLGRLSRIGMIVAGILAIVAIIIHVGASTLLLGKRLAWTHKPAESSVLAMADKVIIIFLGLISIVLSRTRRGPQWRRVIVFFLILAACIATVWDDVDRGDVSLSAGYLTLIILIGVGAMPYRPWQVFVLGAVVGVVFYLSVRYLPIVMGIDPVPFGPESFVLLAMATFLCTFITILIYRSRFMLYEARQKEISLIQSVTDHANKLEDSNLRLRETQDQLIQSEKMASLGNLVAGVAHEVNTPLGAINSNADIAQRVLKTVNSVIKNDDGIPWSNEKEEKVNLAIKTLVDLNSLTTNAASRIDKIVKALRGFACLDEAEYQEFDLHKGIEDTITLLTFGPEMKVEIERDFVTFPQIPCRPEYLNQVFMNLLTNAVEAIGKQGKITIRTRLEKELAVIQFIDTGKGVAPQDLNHIFDPGFTTKGVGVGTGLGLSICYRIIEEHGGRIDVQSEEGKGSTFTIRLPLTRLNAVDEGQDSD